MEKKLFVVTIETEIVVVADNESQAEAAAEHADADEWGYRAATMQFMPAGWDESCIPFGDRDPADPDRTVGQWIDLGAAPKYIELRDKLKKGTPGP